MLSAKRDVSAAKRFFRKMIRADHRRLPFSISVDKNAAYPKAFASSQEENVLPTFYVGNLEYDPQAVGFLTSTFPEGFELQTNITGNSNAGHEFRDGPRGKGVIGPLLTDEEQWAIIEYLKTR